MSGYYLNPGGSAFQVALDSEIYVDKTMIVSKLNRLIGTANRFVCMSRPRRFGKSYVGDLICAYYSHGCDTRHQFDGLKLSQDPSFEKYLNQFDVIRIDLVEFYSKFPKQHDTLIDVIASEIARELRREYPDIEITDDMSLPKMITEIYQKTRRKFVVFIDEYDLLIREKAPRKQFDDYLLFLNGMFKASGTQEAIALAYVTGILPIVRDKIQSKLNVFREYNFLNPGQFTEFMGFTEEETKELCERYDMSFNECKLWYDGYNFKDGTSILSPMSVSEAMMRGEYADYWSQTSSFMVVLDAMKFSELNFADIVLRLVRGEHVSVNVRSFLNTVTDFHSVDDVLTYCIQLGYLAYDAKRRRCYIPNAEVRYQWEFVAAGIKETHVVAQLLKESEDLLQATIEGNTAEVARGLRAAHDVVAKSKGYNDENEFQAAIIYAYYYAQNAYTLVKELPTGEGFADVAFIPKYPTLNYPAFVLELKMNKSTNTAMQQIEQRKYGSDLLHYRGNMLLIAVSYDADSKEHTCQIKPFVIE